jgi:hypothetical protein
MPLAAFVFRIKNPTKQKQTVSLAALMQNPVGYEAAGENNNATNPCFGGNVNEVLREAGAGGLFMRAEASGEPTLDKPDHLDGRQPESSSGTTAGPPEEPHRQGAERPTTAR